MRLLLLLLSSCAAGLVLAMSDLKTFSRGLILVVIALNVVLLLWKSPATSRLRLAGGLLSFLGYAGTVVAWCVLAFGCGIEYSNATSSAIVSPIVTVAAVMGLASLPVGYLGDFSRTVFRQRAGGERKPL